MPTAPGSVMVRSVSPRSTLPRARDPRRKTIGGPNAAGSSRPPSVVLPLPPSRIEKPAESELGNGVHSETTPRTSTLDVRGGPIAALASPPGVEGSGGSSSSATNGSQTNSLNSSMHREREEEDGFDGDLPCSATGTLSRTLKSVTGCKAKRIRFYRNGDQYFEGLSYALRADRLRSLQPLLEELTRALSDSLALPHGVRHIYSVDGQFRITDLDQFEDGESYVCSSSEVFKSLDYSSARKPLWSVGLPKPERPIDIAQLALHAYKHIPEATDFVYPRIITVIRNGVKPRKVVRHLLNKKTARSFTQVVNDLTAVVKLDSGAVKKLFALSGPLVSCLADFFKEDDVFIAYGNERTSADDFFVVSEARRLPGLLDARMNVIRLLGDGNTAFVYEVSQIDSDARFALKVISPDNAIGKVDLIESEISLMRQLNHRNIVKMHDCWPLEGGYYLLLELVQAGDLFEHLCAVRRIGERPAARMVACLANALEYLHQQGIVHRDVKPENLLLYHNSRGDLELKLADFGLATKMSDSIDERTGERKLLTVICGTPTYVAAEVLSLVGYDEKVDVWATGIILYVMLCGFPPFQSGSGEQEELFAQILTGSFGFPSPSWDHISASAKALILNAVTVDTDERLSAADILNNHWITTGGEPSAEFETMAEFVVASRVPPEEPEEMEETEREYYFSRRTSMDDLSEGRRSCEFEFSRSYSP